MQYRRRNSTLFAFTSILLTALFHIRSQYKEVFKQLLPRLYNFFLFLNNLFRLSSLTTLILLYYLFFFLCLLLSFILISLWLSFSYYRKRLNMYILHTLFQHHLLLFSKSKRTTSILRTAIIITNTRHPFGPQSIIKLYK